MNPIVMLAAGKAAEKIAKEVRKDVLPGTYEIDALVRVTATMKVGEDYEAANAQKLCPWTLFKLAASKLNKETLDVIVNLAIESLNSGEEIDASEFKKSVETKAKAMLKETVATNKGKVTLDAYDVSLVMHK